MVKCTVSGKKIIQEEYVIEEALFQKKKIKKYFHKQGHNCSEAIIEGLELNALIKKLLDNAVRRAKGNFRKTVYPRDL